MSGAFFSVSLFLVSHFVVKKIWFYSKFALDFICGVTWFVLKNVTCVFENVSVYSVFRWSVLLVFFKFIWSNMSFKSNVPLLLSVLMIYTLIQVGVLILPTIVKLFSISLLMAINIHCVYLGVLLSGTYIFTKVIYSWWACLI